MNKPAVLVRHIKDVNDKMIATIVATGRQQIGVAVCRPTDIGDRTLEQLKKIGFDIAVGRAKKNTLEVLPNRKVWVRGRLKEVRNKAFRRNLAELLEYEISEMEDRSIRYFKPNHGKVEKENVELANAG